MRIILVMIEPPLPFGNAAARWFYVLLKELVARGHDVTSFAACSKETEIAEAHKLFPAPDYDLRCYPFPKREGVGNKLETILRPYSYMFSKELRSDLDATLAEGYDVLHLEQLWAGWLAIDRPEKAVVNVHHLIMIDQEFLTPKTLRQRMERYLVFKAEKALIRKLRHFRSCSPRLVPVMKKFNPTGRYVTVPVGIDPGQYPYIPDDKRSAAPVVSVIGNMTWYPSSSAAIRLLTKLWPEIKRRVPEARAQIVGWSARSTLMEFLDLPDVTIVENVPDMQPYFERTSVLCYPPTRGSGMKIKILESLGYGIPVVTTSEGSEGLPAIDGVHMGIAEDDAGLIDRVVELLLDPAEQNRQRAAGRELLEDHCGPKTTVDAIENVYKEIQAAGG